MNYFSDKFFSIWQEFQLDLISVVSESGTEGCQKFCRRQLCIFSFFALRKARPATLS